MASQESLQTVSKPVERAKALLAIGEAYRHGGKQGEAIKHYTESRNLASILGHVDCYLWSALGLADSLFLLGELKESEALLTKLDGFVEEGNQRYPLEALHISLSRAVISKVAGDNVDSELDSLIAKYEMLGVCWPRDYIARIRVNDYSIPKGF